jgi:ABC-type sugar transport system ATPase subunit
MALEPDVLLMDEPLSNLDAKLRASLRVEIKNLTRSLGITTLYVTHDQVEAMVMGDKIAVMNNGAIVEQGTPVQLYKRPQNEFVARFLGEMNFVPAALAKNGAGAAAETPWGTVPLDYVSDRIVGTNIKLGFRPEDVRIGEQGDACGFAAQVAQAHYIGDALLCDLVAEGCAFSARLPNTTSLSIGDSVQISLKNSDFTAFPGDVN